SSGRGFAPPTRRTNRPHKDRHLSKLLQLAIAIRHIFFFEIWLMFQNFRLEFLILMPAFCFVPNYRMDKYVKSIHIKMVKAIWIKRNPNNKAFFYRILVIHHYVLPPIGTT
ncbi:MAG: hypothetical protein J6L24_07010, partial [Oscillospiraceae bacterium]|nr:hypothetical protein [Oscillospiraceae bacterium]